MQCLFFIIKENPASHSHSFVVNLILSSMYFRVVPVVRKFLEPGFSIFGLSENIHEMTRVILVAFFFFWYWVGGKVSTGHRAVKGIKRNIVSHPCWFGVVQGTEFDSQGRSGDALWDKNKADIWTTAQAFKGTSELCSHLYSPKSRAVQGSPVILLLHTGLSSSFFVLRQLACSLTSHLHLLVCQCGQGGGILQMKSRAVLPGSASAPAPPCHRSARCTTLACFVNNHLFVAGIVAAITSDLPVSSIMDRLLDANICKSLLLNSPPGWD